MGVSIKREIYRGRYYMIARENNKVVARKRWSRVSSTKTINKRLATDIFKENRTFNPDKKRFKRTNVVEITDFSKSVRRKNRPYMVIVEGELKSGIIITAASRCHPPDHSLRDAKAEAYTSFWELLAQHNHKRYDEDEGKAFEDQVNVLRDAVRQYEPV